MSIYDDDNYYITFGERRQSREEWIAFGDETDGKYDPSYDAASGSDCVTGYTHFPLGEASDKIGEKTNISSNTSQYSSSNDYSGSSLSDKDKGCLRGIFWCALLSLIVIMFCLVRYLDVEPRMPAYYDYSDSIASDTTESDAGPICYDVDTADVSMEQSSQVKAINSHGTSSLEYRKGGKYDPELYHTDYSEDQEDERRRYIDNDDYDDNDGYDEYRGYDY